MNLDNLAKVIIDDLKLVSQSKPNERLPKEDQIRSRIFSELIKEFEFVCSERSYNPAGGGSNKECDIWVKSQESIPSWMEIKRCWSGSFGWITKPAEQLKSWNQDISKLSTVSRNSNRYFFLLGVFDSDPFQHFEKKFRVLSLIYEIFMLINCVTLSQIIFHGGMKIFQILQYGYGIGSLGRKLPYNQSMNRTYFSLAIFCFVKL